MLLYDDVILEAGTYRFSGSSGFVLEDYVPWSEENSFEKVVQDIEQVEHRDEAGYITWIDGTTGLEKNKFKVEKKDEFIADFRVIDLMSEIKSGSYGKELKFIKYAMFNRNDRYWDEISKNVSSDLGNTEFAALARDTYGAMPTVGLLRNLNDTLALSQIFKTPVTLDKTFNPLLKYATQGQQSLVYSVLDRLAECHLPDFSQFSLDHILTLRQDKALESFRTLIHTISAELQTGNAGNVDAIYNQELWKELGEIAPKGRDIVLEIGLGAISFIPIIGNVATVADIGKEIQKFNDFSKHWLSFILHAHQLVA
ncbi:MAG: hypothetical protein ACXADH_01750 [Candidatus Kariarchaeaceae archaeon]|jgi:hypothetical protein